MVEQIQDPATSGPPPVGLAPDYQSLPQRIVEQRARVQKLLLVHNEAEGAWRREDKILEELEDKLYALQQGQMNLGAE